MSKYHMAVTAGSAATIVLVLTAGLHGAALPTIAKLADNPSMEPFLQTLLQPLWLFPIITWLVTAVFLAFQLRSPGQSARSSIITISMIPFLQALALFAFVGHFLGAYALLLAAALMWVSAATIEGNTQPD